MQNAKQLRLPAKMDTQWAHTGEYYAAAVAAAAITQIYSYVANRIIIHSGGGAKENGKCAYSIGAPDATEQRWM